MTEPELFLFSTDETLVERAVRGGAAGVVIDWEQRGKRERQQGADTQINHDTPADLRRLRAATTSRVLCRINGPGPSMGAEIDEACAGGADEILVPMVRDAGEVTDALALVRGRVGLGILVETLEAVRCAPALARLPIARAYLGLMDLAIARESTCPFDAVVDGTLERVRRVFSVPFGFAGLTLPEGGTPVPSRLIAAEMKRLGCGFTFLRRSFLRDVAGRDVTAETARLCASLATLWSEPPRPAAPGPAPELCAAVAAWPRPSIRAAR